MSILRFLLFSAALGLILGSIASAEDSASDLLPRNPAMWLNSPPLSAEALRGKGVFLWFFEETCPSCRGKWPRMYELANQYKGEPIVFIAVNSGNSPAEVQKYAREVKLTWPIVVDPTREFEQQWLDNPISLQNIHQAELILPSGRKYPGQWHDLEASVQDALKGASWKIDPKTIPVAFLPTWQQVELGNYAAAANLLKKGLVTRNEEVKKAAERVHAYVQQQLRDAVAAAEAERSSGNSWKAYQAYRSVSETFAGYDLPASVAEAQKELTADGAIKQQLEAAKALDSIKKAIPTARTETARKRVISRLQQLATQNPDTDAAAEAVRLIEQANQ